MKAKIIILFLSVIVSMAFIAAGYGFWEQALTVTGHITVTRPEDTISRVVPKLASKLTPGAIDLIQGRIKITPGAFDIIIPDRTDITMPGSIDKPTPGGNDTTTPGSTGADITGGTGSGESTASDGIGIAGPDGNGEKSPGDATPELDESSVKTEDTGTVVDGQPDDTNGQPDSTGNSSDNATENSTDIGSGNKAGEDNTGSAVNTPADTVTDPVPQSGSTNDGSAPNLIG